MSVARNRYSVPCAWAGHRVTHHCHTVETGNDSYRFRQSTHQAKARIKSREQARERANSEGVDEPV